MKTLLQVLCLKSLRQMMRSYDTQKAKADLFAGLSVAAVTFPSVMAFAMIAGLNPVYGLYSFSTAAIIATFVGTSYYMVVGPTNPISLVIGSSMAAVALAQPEQYLQAVLLLTLMVGIIQIILSVLKVGSLVHYICSPVVTGLMTGVAVIIAAGQLPKLVGIDIGTTRGLLPILYQTGTQLSHVNFIAVGIGLLSFAIIAAVRRSFPSLPDLLLAICASALLVSLLNLGGDIAVVGEFESSIPAFSIHRFDPQLVRALASHALSIAILGFIQVASIIDYMEKQTGQRSKPNAEFLGLGITNTVCSFFSSFVVGGSFSKTFANYQSGGKTRMSQLLAGLAVLFFLVSFSWVIERIPLASLAAVVMTVAYSMVDGEEIVRMFRTTRFDALVFSATLLMTVLTPRLDYAIYFGVALSFLLLLRSTSKVQYTHLEVDSDEDRVDQKPPEETEDEEHVVIDLSGTLHFNTADNLKEKLQVSFRPDTLFVLRVRGVEDVDVTVLEELSKFIQQVNQQGGRVIFSGVDEHFRQCLQNYGLVQQVGEDRLFMQDDELLSSTKKAVEKAEEEADNLSSEG